MNSTPVRVLYFIACCHIFILYALPAMADLGPKPTISIELQNVLPAPIATGTLLLCNQSDCNDAKPLQDYGPQHFDCSQFSCWGLSYGFSPYLRLKLMLQNGTNIESQIFTKKEFDARFTGAVNGSVLTLREL